MVVTLESVPGNEDPEEVFKSQREALESGFGATDLRATEGTLCGLPTETPCSTKHRRLEPSLRIPAPR